MVAIYLVSGVKLTGRIRGFDKYSVVLESGNQEQLIFKHAISTISVLRGGQGRSATLAASPLPETPSEEKSAGREAAEAAGDAQV